MNQGLIPKRYATALFEYARELSQDAGVYALMKNLTEAFAAMPELQKTLSNPFVGAADKERLLDSAAGAKATDKVFARFVALLRENGRFSMARDIALAYAAIYRRAHGITVVSVTSAAPLSPQVESRLKKLIGSHLDGGSMEYSAAVNPDLIGGFVIQTGNERLDASVANELKQLRLTLISK